MDSHHSPWIYQSWSHGAIITFWTLGHSRRREELWRKKREKNTQVCVSPIISSAITICSWILATTLFKKSKWEYLWENKNSWKKTGMEEILMMGILPLMLWHDISIYFRLSIGNSATVCSQGEERRHLFIIHREKCIHLFSPSSQLLHNEYW